MSIIICRCSNVFILIIYFFYSPFYLDYLMYVLLKDCASYIFYKIDGYYFLVIFFFWVLLSLFLVIFQTKGNNYLYYKGKFAKLPENYVQKTNTDFCNWLAYYWEGLDVKENLKVKKLPMCVIYEKLFKLLKIWVWLDFVRNLFHVIHCFFIWYEHFVFFLFNKYENIIKRDR